jgi:hypothetical protein
MLASQRRSARMGEPSLFLVRQRYIVRNVIRTLLSRPQLC